MAISTNQKPTIYCSSYENTGPAGPGASREGTFAFPVTLAALDVHKVLFDHTAVGTLEQHLDSLALARPATLVLFAGAAVLEPQWTHTFTLSVHDVLHVAPSPGALALLSLLQATLQTNSS